MDNADFYDPFYNQFSPVNSVMQEPIFHHTATTLPDYDIHDAVLMGGFTNLNFLNTLQSNPTEQVEVFTYTYNGGPSGYFVRSTLSMLQRRALHTADIARGTTLVVVGGVDGNGNAHSYGEEYDH